MRIFLAGASGVIGSRLVPLLVQAGHEVGGLTRTPAKADAIAEHGAVPFVADVYDPDELTRVVVGFGPDTVLHELTDLPDLRAELAAGALAANARIRTEGTRNLLAAARAAGAQRLLAQSIAWQQQPGPGADAVAELERSVLDFGGVVLRYGQFYGPGTFFPDEAPDEPRVHIDLAARRTVEALEAPSGIVTITDPD